MDTPTQVQLRLAPQDLETYAGLRERGERAIAEDRLDEALESYNAAWEWAQLHGDRAVVDHAFTNLSAVLISLERGDQVIRPLREILLRSADDVTCRMAAYNIAREYEHRKEFKKSLFYARLARDRTSKLERAEPGWIASSHNQIANCLVADSFFEEAIAEYEAAFAAERSPLRRAVIDRNLGYCFVMVGRLREGLRLLYRSLRSLRRLGARREIMFAHLDLCFSHLEAGRYRSAKRYGEQALAAAETLGHRDARKNALYLLGETASLLGDEPSAAGYFSQLQEIFPETPFVVDFLLAIDVRKMINLRA